MPKTEITVGDVVLARSYNQRTKVMNQREETVSALSFYSPNGDKDGNIWVYCESRSAYRIDFCTFLRHGLISVKVNRN